MLNNHHARLQFTVKFLIGCCVATVMCLWFTPVQAAAQTIVSPAESLTLQVDIGFDSKFKSDYWTPVYVGVNNNTKSDFSGTLSVSTITEPMHLTSANQASPWSFDQPVTIQKGGNKQLTIYLPYFLGNAIPQGALAKLIDVHGKVVASQAATSGYEIKPGNLLVGTLSDQGNSLGPIDNITLPNQTSSPYRTSLDANTMPTTATELSNFDVIVLDDFSSNTLRPDQILALQTWVNQGGILIEVGGPQWQRTLGPLPSDMVPVTINGTTTIPAGTRLFPLYGPFIHSDSTDEQFLITPLSNDTIASTATIRTHSSSVQSETVLAGGTNPLIVESHQGQGVICYLAIDLGSQDLSVWPGAYELWSMMLTHANGDNFLISSAAQGYNSGPGQLLTRAGILDMVEPDLLQGPSIIIALLIGYALILGPLRLLLVKRLKKPQWWSWRIILATVAVFSFVSYELAIYQRSASITDNSVSIIQVNQGGASAHVTTYSGIFVPSSGDFTLHIPGESLAQPVSNMHLLNDPTTTAKKDTPASITVGPHDTNLKLEGLDPWTLHYTVTEQDTQLHGGVYAQLSLHNNSIVGSIQNTLNTPLSDLYLLLSHSFVPIGHLAPGETKQIDYPVSLLSSQPGKTLADQIAQSGGLPAAYFPYTADGRPQSEFQRHMAMLSALNGAGFNFSACSGPCRTRAIVSGDTIYVTGGHVPNPNLSDYEPLQLTGTPATLIGWADQAVTDPVTINGWHPIGHHDNFLQMPLNINIDSPSNLPPGFIQGRVIDIESFDAELTLSGIYTMTEGDVTFEMTVLTSNYLPLKSFTVNVPDLWANPFGPAAQAINTSHLQALLYNWQKNTWDAIPLTQEGNFTTTATDIYMGPGEQVLLQITNKDLSSGKLYFGKPSLHLNGN